MGKELALYNLLIQKKFKSESKADFFLSEILRQRAKLNNSVLRREKYNIIKEIKNHYEVGKELANKLRKSTFLERKSLYAEVYDERHAKLPNNPLVFKKGGDEDKLNL